LTPSAKVQTTGDTRPKAHNPQSSKPKLETIFAEKEFVVMFEEPAPPEFPAPRIQKDAQACERTNELVREKPARCLGTTKAPADQ
jgi:hypothetical protein